MQAVVERYKCGDPRRQRRECTERGIASTRLAPNRMGGRLSAREERKKAATTQADEADLA